MRERVSFQSTFKSASEVSARDSRCLKHINGRKLQSLAELPVPGSCTPTSKTNKRNFNQRPKVIFAIGVKHAQEVVTLTLTLTYTGCSPVVVITVVDPPKMAFMRAVRPGMRKASIIHPMPKRPVQYHKNNNNNNNNNNNKRTTTTTNEQQQQQTNNNII